MSAHQARQTAAGAAIGLPVGLTSPGGVQIAWRAVCARPAVPLRGHCANP